MYEGIVCYLKDIKNHPNADRLNLAIASGYQIIVGKNETEDTLGIFFPSDGCLSKEMLLNNNLYRKHPDTGAQMGGYFEPSGRVKITKLRGVYSNGFWTPIGSLVWTKANLDSFKPGERITAVNGHSICHKYETERTRKAAQKLKGSSKKKQKKCPVFFQHADTRRFLAEVRSIPEGSHIYISEKLHGTSGRTGHLPITDPSKWKKFWNKYMSWTKLSFLPEWHVMSGSRRVNFPPELTSRHDGKYRLQINERFEALHIPKGLTFYYEIVGRTDNGSLIMNRQKTEDLGKEFVRKYGEYMEYTYGTDSYEIYVYNITFTNEDGWVETLPWPRIKQICSLLALNTPPELCEVPNYEIGQEDILKDIVERELKILDSTLTNTHIREGVVLRVETGTKTFFLKEKSQYFKYLEGILKDKNELDLEEVEDNL